ncbi:hypothetical protein [Mucilaginibacter sp. PPCGB 2223]|uniref:hypothetical protein n=1 Tax=Mucilaginibacter sp. PPCGB 2223 TaxID=1886027 RepID=UPI001586546F|nr:hypothetical protein [Mucilaginibacter sp. PPCGB 2223]
MAGRFKLTTFFTSLMFGRPKFKFTVVKAGYERTTVTANKGLDTIRLAPMP